MPGEADFQAWYAGHARKLGLNPNPDAPQHFYDYRAAYRAGATPDKSGHWPSQFKRVGHPRLILGGVDTRTGQSIMPVQKRAGKFLTVQKKRRSVLDLITGATKSTKARNVEIQARKAKRAGVEAHMGRFRTPGGKTITAPLTRSQKATARRGRLTEGITPIQRLTEALTLEKKKKN